MANSCKDSQTPWVLAFRCLRFTVARCWSPRQSSRASRVSSHVAPFGTPCNTSVAQPCKYVDFSRHIQQLCSTMIWNCHQNTAHDVVSSNLSVFTAPAQVPVPLLSSTQASTSFNCIWNSRRVASISAFVYYTSTWNMKQSFSWRSFLVSASVSRRLYIHVSSNVLTACKSIYVSSVFSCCFFLNLALFGQHMTGPLPCLHAIVLCRTSEL
jgi:hypothetical protein